MAEDHLHGGDPGGAPGPAAELDADVAGLPRIDVEAYHPREAPRLWVSLKDRKFVFPCVEAM